MALIRGAGEPAVVPPSGDDGGDAGGGPRRGPTSAGCAPPDAHGAPATIGDWKALHVWLRHAAIEAEQTGAPLSLLMLDLAGLAAPADGPGDGGSGHDHAPQMVARALNEATATRGRLARYTEDRFIAILPGTGLAEAVAHAQRLRARLAPHPGGPGHRHGPAQCAVPIGAAQYRDEEPLGYFIRRTAEALEHAGGESSQANGGRIVAV